MFTAAAVGIHAQTDTTVSKPALNKFLDFYSQNKADSIFNLFSKDTKDALPLEKTRQLLIQLHSQLGNIVKSDYLPGTPEYNVYKNYFEKPGYALFLNFDRANEIIGLFLRPEESGEIAMDALMSPDNVSLKRDNSTLYGTLTIPEADGKVPVVLFIAGSGPTDRNSNSALGLKTNAFLMLAEALKSNGIASLRYDKQGSGKSPAPKEEQGVRFIDFADDAAGFIELLKKDERFSKVIILGHSEGSLVGMLAAQQQKADAFISLAGAGFPVDMTLKRQLKTSLPDSLYHTAEAVIDSMKNGDIVRQKIPDELMALFNRELQPYLISWMKYNPQQEIQKLDIPILVLQGTTDLQVEIEDAEALKNAEPAAEFHLIDGMNHVLKQVPASRELNLASYSNPELPLHPKLITAVVKFVRSLNIENP